ncbi:MAG: response regulator receiver [Hyphomicrobiales bacterium]|nr:response regulator receiver [Hyphomicrobiales bacterium]
MSAESVKKRVLVVDDEDMVRDVVIWVLEDLGFEVMGASSGDQAVDLIAPGAIDLLLTDIRMPGRLDGWTLAEKARETIPDLPVIYVSGFSHEPPRMAKGSIFVQKPLRTETLRRAMQDIGFL